jgi:diacylglycerol kinase family enzyme
MIRAAGHKVNYQSSKQNKWKKALKKPCDIIAVAGGDGTVGKVARRLAGNRIPIAILPVGTANNLAHALGLTGISLKNLVMGWKTARRVNFDVGVAEGPWGSSYFIEGFGVGLFAATIARIREVNRFDLANSARREDEIKSVLRILKEQLHKHRAKKLNVRLDDQDLSGDFLLLEALNIRYVGPNLDLVPGADTNDGLLDVVLVSCGDEAKLRKYLTNCITRRSAKANLPVHRGRRLQIEWDRFPVHIDDKAWPKNKDRNPRRSNAIDISIGAHALVFLTPRRRSRQLKRQSVVARSRASD